MLESELLRQPDAAFGIHPFWFWNGEMADEQIERQIKEMADKGVGGFFLCARQGLEIPYLSEAWFSKARLAVETAKAYGMHVWLYDEYPYPSGMAGGEVTLEHPEAKHYTLDYKAARVSGGETISLTLPWARIVSAKAVPVSASGRRLWEQAVDVRAAIGNWQAEPIFQKAGLTAYNQKRFFTYRTVYKLIWTAPAGEWEVAVFSEKEIDDFKYYGTFVDPCNRQAMETFIRLTHDQYAAYLGDHFGGTIKGMFTDEIGLLGRLPWSPQLGAFFKEQFGYELRDHLHALVDSEAQDAPRVRYHYYQAVHLLLQESYHKPVHDWCGRHGLLYVAEVPAVRMTTQRFSHVPGGDSAHEKLGRPLDWILRKNAGNMRANPKMVSSLARQLNRPRNLIECFHSVGWSMTLQDAKWMIDRMAALGTNFFNFHAFFYTLDGLTKHDAPPSQFLQNPYWDHFRTLGDYTSRISSMMSGGAADIRIALLDPTTTLWTHLGNPFHGFHYEGFGGEEEEMRLNQLRGDWEAIGVHLLKTRRDFDHLDPELLAEAGAADGRLRIGEAAYEVLIVPPVANLEPAAWRKLSEFAASGGKVISFGLLPYEAIEAGSPTEREAMELFGVTRSAYGQYGRDSSEPVDTRVSEGWTKGRGNRWFIPRIGRSEAALSDALNRLSALLDETSPSAVRLLDAAEVYLMQVRKLTAAEAVVFITQQEGEQRDTTLHVDPDRLWGTNGGSKRLECHMLDLETGKPTPVKLEQIVDGWCMPLRFAPYESHTLLIKQVDAEVEVEGAIVSQSLAVEAVAQLELELPSAASWKLEPFQPNSIRFETFELSIGQEGNVLTAGRPVKAKTFIDQCADLAEEQPFPAEFRQLFGTPMRMTMAYPLDCVYTASFTAERLPDSCTLWMDQSAVAGDWHITLNGQQLTSAQFRREEKYDYRNVACDVTALLREGRNEISIFVTVTHDWEGVIDPLYLDGAFGVAFDENGEPVMTALPAAVPQLPETICPGFPYYAGTLGFSRSFVWQGAADSEAAEFGLRLSGWDPHDCVEVFVNGRTLGVRPWSPYRWRGDVSMLKQGMNDLEVRVTGTLIGLLEGNYFDYKTHELRPVTSVN